MAQDGVRATENEKIQSMKDLFDEAEEREKKEKAAREDKKDNKKSKAPTEEKVSDKAYKRVMVVLIPVIVILAIVMVFMAANLVKMLKKPANNNETTGSYIYGTVTYAPESTAFYFNGSDFTESVLPDTTSGYVPNTENTKAPVANTTAPYTVTEGSGDDPLSWSKAKKLSYLSDAVNKTKKLGGTFSVHHTESFTANITECTGGTIGKAVANSLMGMVVKPVDETLNFSSGKAVNSEGEQIEILLPKKGAFSIDEAGVTKAVAYKSGSDTVIEVTLKEETVGVYDVPKYNAGAVGYLDVENFDLMGIEITDASIDYKGTVISVKIGSDGYVKSAEYTIPLHVSGKGAKGSLSGYAVFDGEQRETWEF